MNKKDLKIFLLAFFAFVVANFLYNNFTTETIAKGITFKEVTVKVVGDIELDLDCTGTTNKNPITPNSRGVGEQTTNKCKGKGKITAEFPQQRFVEKPDELEKK